jgi:hypothetical protein
MSIPLVDMSNVRSAKFHLTTPVEQQMSREQLIELQNTIHFTHKHKQLEALERSGEILEPGKIDRTKIV